MFEHCLYFNTTSLARKLEKEWTQAFKPFGLTPAQAFMLRVILHYPGALQSAVAAEMNIARSTATRTLDGLVKLGYAKRVASPADGREFEIHPTPKAVSIKDELNGASAKVTKRMKAHLGAEEFDDVVGKVRSVMKSL